MTGSDPTWVQPKLTKDTEDFKITLDFKPRRVNTLPLARWSKEPLEFFVEAYHVGVSVKGHSFCLDIFGGLRDKPDEFCIREMTKKGTYRRIRRIPLKESS